MQASTKDLRGGDLPHCTAVLQSLLSLTVDWDKVGSFEPEYIALFRTTDGTQRAACPPLLRHHLSPHNLHSALQSLYLPSVVLPFLSSPLSSLPSCPSPSPLHSALLSLYLPSALLCSWVVREALLRGDNLPTWQSRSSIECCIPLWKLYCSRRFVSLPPQRSFCLLRDLCTRWGRSRCSLESRRGSAGYGGPRSAVRRRGRGGWGCVGRQYVWAFWQ